MLFVSKVVQGAKFWIMDTDDGVESVIGVKDLNKVVLEYGIEIAGVTVVTDKDRGRREHGYRYIWSVETVQDPRYQTVAMTKMKVLHGVDIRMNADEIIQIVVDNDNFKGDIVIRVSQWSKKFNLATVVNYMGFYAVRKCTLVLDDSLELYGSFTAPIKWSIDIRELTDASPLYPSFVMWNGWRNDDVWSENLIDHDKRKNFWFVISFMREGWKDSDIPRVKGMIPLDIDVAAVGEYLRPGFESIVKDECGLVKGAMNLGEYEHYRRFCRSIFDTFLTEYHTPKRNIELFQFMNYVMWFDNIPDWAKELYMKLAVRVMGR